MNSLKFRLSSAVLAVAMLTASATPADARRAHKRSERTECRDRDETPYSNRAQRREREARREAKQIERDRRGDGYHFKSHSLPAPETEDEDEGED